MAEKSHWPTNKWIATQVTATVALLTGWVTAGEWNKTLSATVIGLVGQAVVSYMLPNADGPGGVPARKSTAFEPVAEGQSLTA
jgi:hypothetical protein